MKIPRLVKKLNRILSALSDILSEIGLASAGCLLEFAPSRDRILTAVSHARGAFVSSNGTESGTQFVAKRYKTLYNIERAAAEGRMPHST